MESDANFTETLSAAKLRQLVSFEATNDTGTQKSCNCSKLDISTRLQKPDNRKIIKVFHKGQAVWNASCTLCQLVRRYFELSDKTSVPLYTASQKSGARNKYTGKTCDLPFLGLGEVRLLPLALDAWKLRMRADNFAQLVHPAHVDRTRIKQWLVDCHTDHKICNILTSRNQRSHRLPKRLVNVRRMCIEEAPFLTQDYLALSYVWGTIERKELPSQHINIISNPNYLLDSSVTLHTVVRDAIRLTNELGQTYLWVDSLCVRQDDARERAIEIDNMNDIYRSATMTIVAYDSNNADEPLPGVTPYESTRGQPVVKIAGIRMAIINDLELALTEGNDFGVRDVIEATLTSVENREDAFRDLNLSADRMWHKRAWTMQESLLSKRKLFLTARQAFFVCPCSTHYESRQEKKYGSIPDEDAARSALRSELEVGGEKREGTFGSYIFARFKGSIRRQDTIDVRWKDWAGIIKRYTTRESTKPEDRYYAFKGIENEILELWGIQSIAGIPIKALPFGLLWYHDVQKARADSFSCERVAQYPSWSWIGWTADIVFEHGLGRNRLALNSPKMTISRNSTDLTLHFNRAGKVEIEPSISEIHSCIKTVQVAIKNASESDPDDSRIAETGRLVLTFDAQYIEATVLTCRTERNVLTIVHQDDKVGYLVSSRPVPDHISSANSICVHIATTRRYLSRISKNAYLEKGRWPFHRRPVLSMMCVFVVLMATVAGIGIAVWKSLATMGLEGITMPLMFFLFAGLVPLAYFYLSGHVAYVVWMEDVGDGIYERIGAGEISLRVFRSLKPRSKTIRLA